MPENEPLKKDQGFILVVDDQELNRDMLARRLERKGFRTVSVESGPECLELLQRDPSIDLVLLDIEMPGMDGVEVLTRIRESRSRTDLPVIMVTALSDSNDVVRTLQAGANDYVTKPIDYPVALARIHTHLSLKHAEQDLRDSEQRFALAARGANDGLWDWNLATGEIFLSPRWHAMLGLESESATSDLEQWFRMVHPEDLPRLKSEIEAHVEGRTPHFESQHRMLHADGSHRWMVSRALAVRDAEGKAVRVAGSLRDVTTSKIIDPLTELPNKTLLTDRLERMVASARREKDRRFAVLLLDIDRFRIVNDSLGHVVGDRLLIAVARRLESCVRSADTVARAEGACTIARLGGDEFTLLLENIGDPSHASLVADRLHKDLERPVDVEGREVRVHVSVGIVGAGEGYERAEHILRDADTAMHRAKARGGATTEIFEPEMHRRAVQRMELEIELRRALERDEIQVHYQPIVLLSSGKIAGFEALVRWQHPERGLVSPVEFISLAEETGLIVPIGHSVLTQACLQAQRWREAGRGESPTRISVNFSARQFAEPGIIEQTFQVLRETGLEPSCLKLEVTESVIMERPDVAAVTLAQAKEKGIALALDDFGTGYSSLTYLQQFPVDTLKIDRSFVSRIGAEADSLEIVRTIVDLAHNLGMDVTAEGIETADQMAVLGDLGCEYGQGYLFGKPVDAEAAGALLTHEFAVFGVSRP